MSLKINQRVITRNHTGTIRFIGNTKFAPGEWIGVELDDPVGKNDGAIQGQRYFNCRPKHGLFTKKNMVKPCAIAKKAKPRAGAQPRTAQPRAGAQPRTAQPRAGARRPADANKLRTPASSKPRAPIGKQKVGAKKEARARGTPATKPTPSVAASRKPARETPKAAIKATAGAAAGADASDNDDLDNTELLAEIEILQDQLAEAENKVASMELKEFSSSEAIAKLKEELSKEQAAKTEIEQSLRSVIDDRDINKSRHQETSEDIKRYRNEVATFKSSAAKAERKAERLEDDMAELEENMELLTLEKEESAAALEEKEEELLELELQMENLRDEMETLKEAGGAVQVAAVTEGAPPDMVELAKENAKLRHALQALNDQSKTRIADLTKTAHKLEKDAKALTKLKKQFNEQKAQNSQLKLDVEDLKGKLDDASSYEEMVEELSDENMSMKDRLAELENTLKRQKENIEKWKQDYEEEKEFNDTLSLEMEDIQDKMQGEIDTKNSQLAQLAEALTSLQGALGEKQENITTLEAKTTKLNDERLDLLRQLSQLRSQVASDVNGDGGGGFVGSASNQQALSRSLAKLSVESQKNKFLLDSRGRHITQLSALVPVSVLQAERPGMDVSRLLHRLKTKAKYVIARLLRSDSATTGAAHMQLAAGTPRYTSSHLFGDMNLQQFLRNCAGGSHLAIIVREAGRALAVLSNPNMNREQFKAAATAFESPFNVCESTLNEILSTITSSSDAQQGGVMLRKANIEMLLQRMTECEEAVASFVSARAEGEGGAAGDDDKHAESAFLPYEILAIARLIVMDAAAFNAALKLAASQLSVTDENAETEEVKAQKALLNCGREHAETAWATACNLMEKILERCQSGLSSVKTTSITLKDELDATVAATPEGQVLSTLLQAGRKDARELLVAAQQLTGPDGLVATCIQKAPAPVQLTFGEEEAAPPPPPSRFVDLFQRLNGDSEDAEAPSLGDSVKEFQARLQASLRHIESSMLLWMPHQNITVADDENAEVETDENGVEITCLSPLQQSAFRCRQELGASKSLPALLQATKEQLQQSEECVIDQTRKLRNSKMKQQQLQHTLEIQAKQFAESEVKLKAQVEAANTSATEQKDAADAKIKKLQENLKRYSREMMKRRAIDRIKKKQTGDGDKDPKVQRTPTSTNLTKLFGGKKKTVRPGVAMMLQSLSKGGSPKSKSGGTSEQPANVTALEAALTHCSRVSSFWKKRALNKKIISLSPLNVARANEAPLFSQHRSQLTRLRNEVRDFATSASVVRLNHPDGISPRNQLLMNQTTYAVLQRKCKLLSDRVMDSVKHGDDGSDNADAETRYTPSKTNLASTTPSKTDFLAARVTVPAGDDYIGSDGVKGTLKLRVEWNELANIHQRLLSIK